MQLFRQLKGQRENDVAAIIDTEENAQSNNRAVVTSISDSPMADFSVNQLEPGTEYELRIWADNAKGRSADVVLIVQTYVDKYFFSLNLIASSSYIN